MENNIIVITGSIGSGKTRLMQLLSEAYKARGEKVLELDCVEPERIPVLVRKVHNTNIIIVTMDFDRKKFPLKCDWVITIGK